MSWWGGGGIVDVNIVGVCNWSLGYKMKRRRRGRGNERLAWFIFLAGDERICWVRDWSIRCLSERLKQMSQSFFMHMLILMLTCLVLFCMSNKHWWTYKFWTEYLFWHAVFLWPLYYLPSLNQSIFYFPVQTPEFQQGCKPSFWALWYFNNLMTTQQND